MKKGTSYIEKICEEIALELKGKDAEVARLFEANKRLLFKWFHKLTNYYNIPKDEREDVLLEMALNYITALERFDPDRGIKISTFLVPYLKGGFYKQRKMNRQFKGAFSDIEFINNLSLDAPLSRGGESPKSETLANSRLIASKPFTNDVISRLLIAQGLVVLKGRERFVIEELFIESKSIAEITEIFGCTRSYIYRLRDDALKKMNKAILTPYFKN